MGGVWGTGDLVNYYAMRARGCFDQLINGLKKKDAIFETFQFTFTFDGPYNHSFWIGLKSLMGITRQ